MSTLAETHFNYFMHEWGPDRKGNRRAIEEFEEWLRNQNKPISITGRVIGIDGQPAAGYGVTTLPRAWSTQSGVTPTTRTDAGGRFSFRGLPDGPCDLSATPNPKTNQPNMRIEGLALKKGQPVDVMLSMEQKYSFGGQVTDSAGTPQPDRNVLAIWKSPDGKNTYSRNTKTDEEGRYRFASPFEQAKRVLINDGGKTDPAEHRDVRHGRDDVDFTLRMEEIDGTDR